ncbi:START domain-containing protein [Ditylenchus destructor]|uniref:START domain-containing protein n=1 Tax=Ditylenchus destructor TaxID=166010 RepID=A0AAD4N5V9_9BILA|nr:START domain-containing protein [Ditylenchus destructor]
MGGTNSGLNKEAVIAESPIPPYSVKCIGSRHFIVAGGGGAVKTGVKNEIDALLFKHGIIMTEQAKNSVLDSLEIVKSRGIVTLKDEEYFELGSAAAAEVRRLCSDLSLWKVHSNSNGVSIFDRKSELSHATEKMLLAIVDLPCTMQKLEKLVSPWDEYRVQWDSMLEGIDIVYLVRHMVKRVLPMSARDSIDVVKVLRSENEIVFGSTSTVHGNYPPSNQYVRSHQHIGGYMLRPSDSDPDQTKFHMVFHADLNLSGGFVASKLVGMFKPNMMLKKMDNLRGAIQNFEI